jgi:hypothetical protein
MFGLFKPQAPSVKVIDRIWISLPAKLEVCRKILSDNTSTLFVVWFEESFQQFQSALHLPENSQNIKLAQDLTKADSANRPVVFAEHYPLRTVEQHLFLQLNLSEATVLSSTDEPFFEHLGGGRMMEMMKRMNITEEEEISHPMVTKSIERAQEKFAKSFSTNRKATSQREWFLLNKSKEPNAYKR